MNENINLPELPMGDDWEYSPKEVREAQRAAVLADRAQRQEPAWWASALNRRATVEQWMFDAARGKRPMPTAQELREWAIKLGTPAEGEPIQQQAVPQELSGDDAIRFARESGMERASETRPLFLASVGDLIRFARLVALSASPTPPARKKTKLDLTLTKDELECVAAFLNDDDERDDDAVRLLLGDGHSGYGLYAAHPEYPEEGAILVKNLPSDVQAQDTDGGKEDQRG